jgi:hypothetical protein
MSDFQDSVPPQPEPGACGNPPRPPKQTARGLEDNPQWRGSILDEIEYRLARFPQAIWKRDKSSIRCFPCQPNGFVVGLKVVKTNVAEPYSVYYGGSHEEFSSRGSTVTAFGFGLSDGCRLKEYSRNGRAYRWIVEFWDVNLRTWKPDWDYGQWETLVRLIRHAPSVRYLQNGLIDLDSDELSSAA